MLLPDEFGVCRGGAWIAGRPSSDTHFSKALASLRQKRLSAARHLREQGNDGEENLSQQSVLDLLESIQADEEEISSAQGMEAATPPSFLMKHLSTPALSTSLELYDSVGSDHFSSSSSAPPSEEPPLTTPLPPQSGAPRRKTRRRAKGGGSDSAVLAPVVATEGRRKRSTKRKGSAGASTSGSKRGLSSKGAGRGRRQ